MPKFGLDRCRQVCVLQSAFSFSNCRRTQQGPPGYSPGVGKFESDIFNGLDNLYPGGPFDPLGG